MRRGILGGTFDPPHLAHLVAAETAFRQLGLDVVTLVPAGDPWQKADRRVVDSRHRLAMTELACSGVDYFEVDDREIRRPGPTYTIDTVTSLASDRIVLILGADAAAGLDTWHRAGEVRRRVEIAVMPRPGTAVSDVVSGPGVVWLDAPQLAVSSTELRSRIAAGLSIRFLVTDGVRDYIERHGLYRD